MGCADIWGYEQGQTHKAVGGKSLKIINLLVNKPIALALRSDGDGLYAAVLHSGNQATVVHIPAFDNQNQAIIS